jgi:hypothetical protein
METFCSRVTGSSYEKQKSALVRDFEGFLKSNENSGYTVTSGVIEKAKPEDVVKFLVDRDSRGRTQSHNRRCKFLGSRGLKNCGCITTLAEGTVDSFIGQLRAFYNSIGKNSAWRPNYKWGNPCDSVEVK